MLKITSLNHLRQILRDKGYDKFSRQTYSMTDVFKAAANVDNEVIADASGIVFEDAMSVANLIPLLPQTIVQVIKETMEPLLIGTSLLDRWDYVPGQQIVFPAVGGLYADDVAEGQAFPEVQPQIGGATMTATMNKSGIAFKITRELLKYSNWDVLGLTFRESAKALARRKEVKIFDYIRSMGIATHDNLNPVGSHFGTCSGRSLTGAANGAAVMDDVFDAYAQVITQGFIPDTILMHPLTWVAWVKDPTLRAFAMAAGGGSFFASHTGNPAGRAPWTNGPQGQLGHGTGQFITPGNTVSGDTPSDLLDHPQTINSAPQLPGYFPFPLRILVSPFMPFDPHDRLTDIFIFDSSRLGALIVDEELTTEEWDDPAYETRKVKLRERYGIGIYEEGAAIGVMRNVVITPNQVVLPAQTQISISGSVDEIDHTTAISL